MVSAGNTGALLALAKIVIKTMSGIDRPAMAAIAPSVRGDVVMLDLGANVVCDTRNLVEFAVMGDVFARTVLGLTAPTIGLLNVGSEELKGDDRIRAAADVLRESHIGPQFHGFVEGHDIAAGTTDVVVTDGFTGNIALKTTEGTAKLVMQLLRQAFTASLSAKLGYLLARSELERLRELVDPRRYNGAVMVGLNGVVVKSHGGTDGPGFAHAVDVAMDMVVHRFNDRIREGLARIGPQLPAHAAAERPGPQRAGGTGTQGWTSRRPTTASALRPPAEGGCACPAAWPRCGPCWPASAPTCRATVVSNDELAERVDTSDAWIRERTGIRQRYLAAPHETCAYMAHRGRPRRPGRRRRRRPPRSTPSSSAPPRPTRRFPATAARVQGRTRRRRLRLRPFGGVQRLHLRAVGGRRDDPHRPGARRAGDRLGSVLAHHELAGPRHLRAVRRRRRRGVPARRPGRRPGRRRPASCPPTCTATAGWATSSTSTARSAGPDRPGPPGDERPRGVPPRRHPPGRGGHRGAGRQRADQSPTWTGWCRTRRTRASSTGSAAGWACRAERVVLTVDRHANTSAASIPLALAEAYGDGRIRRGQLVLLEALGGGLTWGSALVRM